MPSGAKGKNVYQGSTAILTPTGGAHSASNKQSENIEAEAVEKPSMVDSEGGGVDMGEGPSTAVGTSGGSGNARGADNDEENDHDPPATSPPPSPSIASKRRFSAIDSESVDTSRDWDMVSPSARVTPASRSLVSSNSSTSKRGRMTGAIALANIGHTFSDFNSNYRIGLDRQEARHRQREDNPMNTAIERAQEVESDLTPDELAGLLEVFQKERDSARAYLLIKNDSVRKAWIKRKLASISSPSVPPS